MKKKQTIIILALTVAIVIVVLIFALSLSATGITYCLFKGKVTVKTPEVQVYTKDDEETKAPEPVISITKADKIKILEYIESFMRNAYPFESLQTSKMTDQDKFNFGLRYLMYSGIEFNVDSRDFNIYEGKDIRAAISKYLGEYNTIYIGDTTMIYNAKTDTYVSKTGGGFFDGRT